MIRGRVHNGVVVLEVPKVLREGTEVVVEPLPRSGKKGKTSKGPTVSRALAKLAGKAKNLPPDAARNVDHYLYGHAKRMSTLLADTSFFVAYLNPRDEYHVLAVEWMTTSSDRIVTSDWVLAELGNYLAEGRDRRLFGTFVRVLSAEKRIEIVPANRASFLDALNLYMRRPDKLWSFTDCTSFCLMKARRITDALTTDHHFEQAGFTMLLK